MRHRKAGVKLNRTTSHRQAMFRNMVTSLLKHDRIRTTDVKAKELRRWADHIITLAKRGDLHARRQVMAIVREKDVVHQLFEDASARFGNTNGGYTRIVKIGLRPGDSAPISMIELVAEAPAGKKDKKKKKGAATADKAQKAKAEPKSQKDDEAPSAAKAPAPAKAETPKAEAADSAPAESAPTEPKTDNSETDKKAE
jgi:large subunit ribosomal protein L17